MNNLILIGFMASGKSTVGAAFAEKHDLMFYDVDEYVEEHAKATIAEIFETEGEAYFRKLEKKAYRKLLGKRHVVIATGGGIIQHESLCKRAKRNNTVVYLNCAEEILKYHAADGRKRPLWDLKLLEERRALYEKHADVQISTEGTIEAAVAQLEELYA